MLAPLIVLFVVCHGMLMVIGGPGLSKKFNAWCLKVVRKAFKSFGLFLLSLVKKGWVRTRPHLARLMRTCRRDAWAGTRRIWRWLVTP